jgi:hypothetical protein
MSCLPCPHYQRPPLDVKQVRWLRDGFARLVSFIYWYRFPQTTERLCDVDGVPLQPGQKIHDLHYSASFAIRAIEGQTLVLLGQADGQEYRTIGAHDPSRWWLAGSRANLDVEALREDARRAHVTAIFDRLDHPDYPSLRRRLGFAPTDNVRWSDVAAFLQLHPSFSL